MPKAKKLPSGSWRVQIFDHEETVTLKDGTIRKKNIMKSFTVKDPSPAGKRECERLAAEWAAGKSYLQVAQNLTVKEAIAKYIDEKSRTLSPTTIKAYRSHQKQYFDSIAKIRIDRITEQNIQDWVNTLADTLSPKTVKNVYSLLMSSLNKYGNGMRYRVTLPMRKPPILYTPSDEDVKKVLNEVKGSWLEVAIMLAAFGTLRRGEVCALTSDDIKGNTIIVNKAVVSANGTLVVKTPKTSASYRQVILPDFVIDRIKPIKGRLVPVCPNEVTKDFEAAVKRAGVPHFRFHDLRAYSVSIAHALGVPDAYLQKRGGWKTDTVLKQVYRRTIDSEEEKFASIINNHFSEEVHTKLHTE